MFTRMFGQVLSAVLAIATMKEVEKGLSHKAQGCNMCRAITESK